MNSNHQRTLNYTIAIMLFCTFLLFISHVSAYGQKLPSVQVGNLRAPENIKIDGKSTEWGTKYQAYNHATDIFYTICNDDDNLYLVVHASDPDVLTKITNRGVVFSINASELKEDKNSVSITYPVFELKYGNKPFISFTNAGMLHSQRLAMEQNPDSVSKLANKKLRENEKFIRTTGMPGIDTLLSIYNRNGIRAAEAFDSTMAYTYELAIPLKYINKNRALKLTYHITLPGIDVDKDFAPKLTKNDNGTLTLSYAPGAVAVQGSHLPAVTSTTDFWGEYTLAKN